MEGHRLEVAISRQEMEAVADGEAGEKGVHRADLNAAPAAMVPEGRGLDVIFDLGHEDGKHPEFRENLLPLGGPLKSLKQLLDHETGRDDDVLPLEAPAEKDDLRSR